MDAGTCSLLVKEPSQEVSPGGWLVRQLVSWLVGYGWLLSWLVGWLWLLGGVLFGLYNLRLLDAAAQFFSLFLENPEILRWNTNSCHDPGKGNAGGYATNNAGRF